MVPSGSGNAWGTFHNEELSFRSTLVRCADLLVSVLVSRDDGLWIAGAHHVTDPHCPVSYFTQKTFYGDVAAIHFVQTHYDPALEEFRKENVSDDDSPLSSPRGYDGDICTAPTTPPK